MSVDIHGRFGSEKVKSTSMAQRCARAQIREFAPKARDNYFNHKKRRYFRTQATPFIDPTVYQNALPFMGVLCTTLFAAQHQKSKEISNCTRFDSNVAVESAEKSSRRKGLNVDWGGCDSEGPRDEMEDCWCMNSLDGGKVLYFGVFDGHGGAASSAFLKNNLLRFTSEAGTELCKSGSPLEHGASDINKLSHSFEQADSALLDYLGTLGDPECWSGSTATVVFLNSDVIVTANVGDSRAVLGKKGKTVDISSDHRPVASSKVGRSEIKRISDSGGWVLQMRVCGILAVTRAFGDYEFKGGRYELLEELRATGIPKSVDLARPPVIAVPDVRVLERTADDDFLIIATDGLWDVMNSAQAVTFVRSLIKRKPDSLMDEVAQSLVDRAIKSRTQDNVSCLVIDLRTSS